MGPIKKNIETKSRRVTFSLEAENAQEVYLAGEFNKWNATKHPMKRNRNGRWTKQLTLPPGDFEYKFVVDDQWIADPKNERILPNSFGTWNSVIKVKP